MLLSREVMKRLGANIDLVNDVVSFDKLGVEKMPLHFTKAGQPAVNLLDFPLAVASGPARDQGGMFSS